jgi:hypothetical protein
MAWTLTDQMLPLNSLRQKVVWELLKHLLQGLQDGDVLTTERIKRMLLDQLGAAGADLGAEYVDDFVELIESHLQSWLEKGSEAFPGVKPSGGLQLVNAAFKDDVHDAFCTFMVIGDGTPTTKAANDQSWRLLGNCEYRCTPRDDHKIGEECHCHCGRHFNFEILSTGTITEVGEIRVTHSPPMIIKTKVLKKQ